MKLTVRSVLTNTGLATAVLTTTLLLGFSAIRPEVAAAADPSKRVSIQLGGGLSGLAMSDVNDELERGNLFMATKSWRELDDLSRGFSFLGSVRSDLVSGFGVVVGIGSVSGSAGVDFDQVIDVETGGTLYFARATYHVPFRPRPSVRMFVEAGPLLLRGGKLDVRHERRSDTAVLRLEELTVEHSGAGGEALASLEMVLNETITFVTDVGYRYLKADAEDWETRISRAQDPIQDQTGPDGEPNGIPDGQELIEDSFLLNAFLQESGSRLRPDMKVDYSGLQGNVGLRFYLF